ncbi:MULTISPECIES: NAD-dependent epimerase/dehydratase family protein [unclassified Mycobacterium]|uniref:NAD-dependent epimerase/dehydratase family protein n=1 Tax=unclassified Mycobacterium TaxID=2642494 RepID=UPI0029C6EF99|nr:MULTISPECIES: NAD-dependent epimerase/dehydratase family protein [unclassified Mycobacterium]
MRVLVTGGTGFTGSHTACALVAAGHDVRLLARDPGKVRNVFAPHGFVPEDVVVGDMTDAAAVDEALVGCDGVVHVAAVVDLRRSMARMVEDTNVRGVELVVGGAAQRGLPSIVYVSSLGVFFRPGGPALTPALPIAPGTTAYARSKARSEAYVRRLQVNGAHIRICYPAAISGPDDPGMSEVNTGLASFMKDVFMITSSGLQVVDVRDLATLHVKLLELPDGAHRYAACAEMLTWPELHRLVCQLTGRSVRHFSAPGALLRAAGYVGDALKRVHDFDFPLTRDGMEFTTRWPGADAERTTRELGLSFRDVATTYRDTLAWMYRAGHLSAAQVGKLAKLEAMS